MDLERAIEVAVKAFCQGKSRTYPYVAERVDGLWVLQDTPPRKNSRKIEVFTFGLEPPEVIERIHRQRLGWHFVCDVYADERHGPEVRAKWKSAGYRALSTEWFFVHDLAEIPHCESDPPVRLVESPEMHASIRQRATQKRGWRPDARQYAIWDDDLDVGWVASVPYGPDAWVSDLFVYSDCRGQGFGRALMSRLLQDDAAEGVRSSVLIASTLGARLYPKLGYRQIGVLQVFCPVER